MRKNLILIIFALFFATTAWAVSPAILQMVGGGTAATGNCSGTLGTTTYTAGQQTPSAATICYVKPITMDCDDTGGKFCARLYNVNTTDRRVSFGIYDDDGGGGEPSTLLDSYVVDDTFGTVTNHCEDFTATLVDTNTYYVGFCVEATQTSYGAEATSGSSGERYIDHSSYTMPSPWPHATDSTSSYNRTIWMDFD
jgi:hypothetical protein